LAQKIIFLHTNNKLVEKRNKKHNSTHTSYKKTSSKLNHRSARSLQRKLENSDERNCRVENQTKSEKTSHVPGMEELTWVKNVHTIQS
jgi:hypothetical protein